MASADPMDVVLNRKESGPECHPEDIEESSQSDRQQQRHAAAMQQQQQEQQPEFTTEMLRGGTGGIDPSIPKTGPKGVKADYKMAQQRMIERRIREKVQYDLMLQRQAVGAEQFIIPPQISNQPRRPGGDDDDSEDDSDFDDDDEAFSAYRAQRLSEFMPERPSFGTLTRIKRPKELPETLDKLDQNTMMVLHFGQNHIESCVRLNECLQEIAAEIPHIKFAFMKVTDVLKDFKDEDCPHVVVFRGADILRRFNRITKDIGDQFRPKDIVQWMNTNGILNGTLSKSSGGIKTSAQLREEQINKEQDDEEFFS